MGFLELGQPLDYDSILGICDEVRDTGIEQAIFSLKKNYDRFDNELFFGDETEYMIVKIDNDTRKAQVALIGSDIIQAIPKDEAVWAHMEYGSYMVETIPSKPFKADLSSILEVQNGLKLKRNVLQKTINSLGYSKCYPLQLTSFPRLGCKDSIAYIENQPNPYSGELCESIFVPDAITSSHPRFISFARNIRLRRGGRVSIFAPVYKDKHTKTDKLDYNTPIAMEISTPIPFYLHNSAANLPDPDTSKLTLNLNPDLSKNISKIVERGSSYNKIKHLKREKVKYSDSIPLEELLSPTNISNLKLNYNQDKKCSECQFSPCDFREKLTILNRDWIEEASRSGNENPIPSYIYMDTMAFGMGMCCYQITFSFPNLDIARYAHDQFLALSPYFLALTAACPVFRGLLAATDTRWDVLSQSVDDRTETDNLFMPKSRFSSNSLYISSRAQLADNYFKFNDILLPTNIEVYNKCISHGVDPILAHYMSHIFTRDPLWLSKSKASTENKHDSFSAFQAFQSANWNSVRFKLPSLPLLPNGKSELGYRVEFRCSEMQLTDFENAAVAAVLLVLTKMIINGELNLYIPISYLELNMGRSSQQSAVHKTKFYYPTTIDGEYVIKEDTLLNILFGENGLFTKCVQFMRNESLKMNEDVGPKVAFIFEKYMELFRRRCEGTLPTSACFIRQFVLLHELYKQDSVVSEEIACDLCDLALEIQSGYNHYSEMLLGDLARYN